MSNIKTYNIELRDHEGLVSFWKHGKPDRLAYQLVRIIRKKGCEHEVMSALGFESSGIDIYKELEKYIVDNMHLLEDFKYYFKDDRKRELHVYTITEAK